MRDREIIKRCLDYAWYCAQADMLDGVPFVEIDALRKKYAKPEIEQAGVPDFERLARIRYPDPKKRNTYKCLLCGYVYFSENHGCPKCEKTEPAQEKKSCIDCGSPVGFTICDNCRDKNKQPPAPNVSELEKFRDILKQTVFSNPVTPVIELVEILIREREKKG